MEDLAVDTESITFGQLLKMSKTLALVEWPNGFYMNILST